METSPMNASANAQGVSAHLVHVLSESAVFEDVPAERLPRIARLVALRTHERGERLDAHVDSPDRATIVASGSARISRIAPDGRSITVALLDAGDLFGRLPFGEAAMGERVEALERCTVIRMAAADLERVVLEEPAVARALIACLARRVETTDQRLESLAFHQVPARFARVLVDLAERYGKVTANGVRVDMRITHGQLAELVGTTRETLTKVSSWLRAEGVATLERRQIWISDYPALEHVAAGGRQMPGRAQRNSARGHDDADLPDADDQARHHEALAQAAH